MSLSFSIFSNFDRLRALKVLEIFRSLISYIVEIYSSIEILKIIKVLSFRRNITLNFNISVDDSIFFTKNGRRSSLIVSFGRDFRHLELLEVLNLEFCYFRAF